MVVQLVTVAGTLAGAVLGAVLGALAQGRADRRRDALRNREEQRARLREACADLDAAVTELRGLQFRRHRLRTSGAPAAEQAVAKTAALDQRTRVTGLWTRVQLLTDDAALLDAAERLVLPTHELHRAEPGELAERRRAGHAHRAAFLDAARRVLGVTTDPG